MAEAPDGYIHRTSSGKTYQKRGGQWVNIVDVPRQPPVDVEANRKEAVGSFIEGLNPIERFGIGAREPIANAGRRLEQFMGLEQTPEQMAGPAAPMPPEYSGAANDFATTAGRVVPAVAALSRVPGGILPQAGAGAAYGAATSEDPMAGAVAGGVGGAAGSAIAGGVGRLANAAVGNWATRSVSKLPPDLANTLGKFQELGGRLTPGQAAPGKTKRVLDEALANNAFTGTAYAAIERTNQRVLNNVVSKALGVSPGKGIEEIGPSTLRAADDAITRQFNNVAAMIPGVPVAASVADDMADLLTRRTLEPFKDRIAAGTITGRDYMSLRSELLQITRGNSDKVDAAWSLIDDMDDLVDGVAPAGYKEAYAAARERFKVMLSVDKYRRGISGGDANAPTLDGAVQSIFRKQYTRAKDTLLPETGDFFTAVRALSDPRLAPLTGGSATARRVGTALTGGVLGGAAFTEPLTAAALASVALVAPRAALAAPAPDALRRAGGIAGTVLATGQNP